MSARKAKRGGQSNASRGAYYKARSKRWLQARGYSVADLEQVRIVLTPTGMVPVKRDQWGSDLAYLDVADDAVVFVQVKGGLAPGGTLLRSARAAFAEHRFPATSCRTELHIWRPRARQPEVHDCC